MDNGKYYLYRHIRLDKNEPFYIGIGSKDSRSYKTYTSEYRRAYSKSNRTNYWRHIVAINGYEVEILLESNDYAEIKRKETEFIKLYGREDLGLGTLVNLTDGGDGAVGCIQSAESRLKKSINSTKPMLGIKGKNSPCAKKVYQYDLQGNFIKEHGSLVDAYIENNIKEIGSRDESKPFYSRGFQWTYEYLGNKINKHVLFDYKTHKISVLMLDKNDNILKEFDSAKDAADYLGNKNKAPDINRCCNGIRKTASNYKWKFK